MLICLSFLRFDESHAVHIYLSGRLEISDASVCFEATRRSVIGPNVYRLFVSRKEVAGGQRHQSPHTLLGGVHGQEEGGGNSRMPINGREFDAFNKERRIGNVESYVISSLVRAADDDALVATVQALLREGHTTY